MEAVLNQNHIAKSIKQQNDGSFGEKIGIIASLFGCWHKHLSRPMTTDQVSHRTCLHCGARQKFDATQMKTSRKFYYPPKIS